ncbi:MAG: hypothetical protein CBC44_002545 [Flavobacteriales bacterium TMED84]|nr:hypothetical protein [Crocinitomicaceae bacterium]RPG53397.1 MAG: hypothetical protein CBC44_002545 [Flavobacteriales bacterium TMED84]
MLNNKYLIVSISILAIYLLPYYYDIENSKFLIHDNLDSNIVWYKNLVESGELFNHNNGHIEISQCGMSRMVYPSDFNFLVITYFLFSAHISYCFLNILMHLIAFLGMYFLCIDYVIKGNKMHFICAYLSLVFSLVPFWPSGFLTISGQPLLIWSFLNLINKRNLIISWILIFLFPFCSSLFFGNIFLVVVGFFFTVFYFKKKSIIHWNIISAFLLITFLSIVIEHRIFDLYFLSKTTLNRSFGILNEGINFKGLAGISISQMLKGQYHFFGRIWPFIPLFVIFNFVYVKSKKIIVSILFIIFLSSTLTTAKDLNFVTNFLPFFKSFNPRFISVNTTLWYIIFALTFEKFETRPRLIKISSYLILVSLIISAFFNFYSEDFQDYDGIKNSFYHTYVKKNSDSHKSFNKFYQISDFKKIKSNIDSNSRVCCLGILPEIAQFNGLKTIGGYYPVRYQSKCNEFNYLMNRAEEFCGRKLYLTNDDIKRLKLKRLITKNVNYLITNKQIINNKLLFVGKSNKVWLYKLRSISKIH